jgi:uncharacterized protein YgiM (DUF1202 family)
MKRAMVGILVGLFWLPWMNIPADCQETVELQPFDIAAVEVHAIAWAVRPADRIAAVDDRILREGMAHRGAEVVEIRPDSVVFSYAGRMLAKKIRENENKPASTPEAVPRRENQASGGLGAASGENRIYPWTGRTVAELSNIRTAPDPASEIAMRVRSQTPLQVMGKRGGWLRLLLRDGSTGWIHPSLIRRDDTP